MDAVSLPFLLSPPDLSHLFPRNFNAQLGTRRRITKESAYARVRVCVCEREREIVIVFTRDRGRTAEFYERALNS